MTRTRVQKSRRMSQDAIFDLYKLVQQKDHAAEDALIEQHRLVYPSSHLNKVKRGKDAEYRRYLHTMYLHLTR